MHSGKPLSFKATAPRVATAVVATPRFGCRRLQRPCSTEIYGRRSQSSSPKMPSISPRELQRSILSTITYIPRATKDDDDAVALAAELYLADVWPDFSKKKVDPAVRIKFFNRKREYDMIVDHLKEEPTVSLLLLGPKNSGKSVSQCQLPVKQHIVFFITFYNSLIYCNLLFPNLISLLYCRN